MRRIAQALSGAVALLLTVTGLAHADVAHVNTSSITATSSSISIGDFPVAGAGRVLAVGVSTVESVTVTGVTYGGQPLTSRIARAAHGTRAEIWTLTAPATGSGTVQVTLSGNATATVGASLFTGVDQADPVMAANAGDADTGATSAVAVLNNTTAIDGMLGVLALGNVENTYNVRAGGSTDLVTSDVRWNEVGSVRAAGATRSGNTGQNMALTAGVNWRWNRIDPAQKNPYTLAIVGLRAGAVNTVPSAAAGGPYTTTEGNGVTLDASGSSDADGDTLSYEWDVDGDGAVRRRHGCQSHGVRRDAGRDRPRRRPRFRERARARLRRRGHDDLQRDHADDHQRRPERAASRTRATSSRARTRASPSPTWPTPRPPTPLPACATPTTSTGSTPSATRPTPAA